MQELYFHINRYCTITPQEFTEISSYFSVRSLSKKEHLYRPGSPLPHYFVLSGCVHLYLVNERGSEQTLQFAIDQWWLTDYLAFQKNKSSEFYIQAVHPSEVASISYEDQELLLQRFPQLEAYFRKVFEIAYGAAINRMKYIFTCSKEEIYFKFKEAFPEFVQEVPQYLVATYLGLSPEYVSKLNKKQFS